MYLCDRDLRELLPTIRFETQNPEHPFKPDDQIQPCSIDLRLDNVFWRQRSRAAIDLRRSKLLELSPRRHWKKIILEPGESITIAAECRSNWSTSGGNL
jgi:deoxycytidine triphosphate deaminase